MHLHAMRTMRLQRSRADGILNTHFDLHVTRSLGTVLRAFTRDVLYAKQLRAFIVANRHRVASADRCTTWLEKKRTKRSPGPAREIGRNPTDACRCRAGLLVYQLRGSQARRDASRPQITSWFSLFRASRDNIGHRNLSEGKKNLGAIFAHLLKNIRRFSTISIQCMHNQMIIPPKLHILRMCEWIYCSGKIKSAS